MEFMQRQRLTVGERILLYLSEYSRYEERFEVPKSLTQEGIGEGVGISRAHAAIELQSLKEKALVSEKLSHVTDHPIRKKVYFLTSMGNKSIQAITVEALSKKVELRDFTGTGEIVDGAYALQTLKKELSINLPTALGHLISQDFIDMTELRKNLEERRSEKRVWKRPEVKLFFGRTAEMEFVRESMTSQETSAVVVTGIAGIGKTTFVAKCLENEDNVLWYSVHEWDNLLTIGRWIAERLSDEGRTMLAKYIRGKETIDIGDFQYNLKADLKDLKLCLVFDDIHKAELSTLFPVLISITSEQPTIRLILISRSKPGFYGRSELIKKKVRELILSPLDRISSIKLLTECGVVEGESERGYRLTGGHPMSLELYAEVFKGKRSSKEITSYIKEEVISGLPEEEKNILKRLCVFRQPVSQQAFLEDKEEETLPSTLSRFLIRETGDDNHGLNDSIREILYASLLGAEKLRFHAKAAEYYRTLDGEENIVELLYHLTESERWEQLASTLMERGEELIKLCVGLVEMEIALNKLLRHTGDEKYRKDIWFLLLKGEVLKRQEKWRDAISHYNRILSGIRSNTFESVEVEKRIGNLYELCGELGEAEKYYKRALREALRGGHEVQLTGIYRSVASLQWNTGFNDLAAANCKKGLKLLKRFRSPMEEARIYTLLGNIYTESFPGTAEKYFNKSLNILRREGDVIKEQAVYLNLGVFYERCGNLDRAIRFLEKSIQLSRKSGGARNLGYANLNISHIFIRKGEDKKAKNSLSKALMIFETIEDRLGISLAQSNMGTLCLNEGKWLDGEVWFAKSLSFLEKSKYISERAEVYYEYAMFLKAKGDIERAKSYLKKAISIVGEGRRRDIENTLRKMSRMG